MPVVRHAVREAEKEGPPPDTVLILQATTPFRSARSIENALEKISTGRFTAVVSVTSDLSLRWKAEDGRLRPLFDRGYQMGDQGYPWMKVPPGLAGPIDPILRTTIQ